MRSSFFIFFLLCTLTPFLAHAQARPTFTFKIVPENYKANDIITVSISSYSIRLDQQNITWSVDGNVILEGKGKKSVSMKAPANGNEKEVVVTVENGDNTVEQIFTLRSNTLQVYIESADGYTPVWYRGRSSIAEESFAKVVAIPASFPAIDGDINTVYTWSKNNAKDAAQSGTGRQAYVLKLSPFNNTETVTVSTPGFQEDVVIVPQATQIGLYEYSPLIGTRFNSALRGSLTLDKQDVTFEVIPWFFSGDRSTLKTSWSVNGLPSGAQAKPWVLNIRKNNEQKGDASIQVSVKHTNRTLQNLRSKIDIDL